MIFRCDKCNKVTAGDIFDIVVPCRYCGENLNIQREFKIIPATSVKPTTHYYMKWSCLKCGVEGFSWEEKKKLEGRAEPSCPVCGDKSNFHWQVIDNRGRKATMWTTQGD